MHLTNAFKNQFNFNTVLGAPKFIPEPLMILSEVLCLTEVVSLDVFSASKQQPPPPSRSSSPHSRHSSCRLVARQVLGSIPTNPRSIVVLILQSDDAGSIQASVAALATTAGDEGTFRRYNP